MTTKQSGFVGGEQARSGEPLDNFGGRLDRWGPKPEPTAKAEDTAAAEQDEIDAELDREDEARAANLRRLGLADPETTEKAPSLADVERELAEVTARMKTVRGAEFNALDRRQLELIQVRLDLQAGKAPADDAEGEETDAEEQAELTGAEAKLAALQEELTAVREKVRTSKGAKLDEAEARELELIAEIETVELATYVGQDIAATLREEWASEGGVEARLPIVANFAVMMRESLPEAERGTFAASFDALPQAARAAAYRQFSVSGGSLTKKVSAVLGGLSGSDKVAAEAWWGKWKTAVEKGLVG